MQQDPFIGTTPGQRIGILITIILIGFYSYLVRKNFKIAFLNGFLFYVLFFFISTLPSLVTFLIKGFNSRASDVATLFFSPTDFLNQKAFSIDISLHKKIIFIYIALIIFILFFSLLKNQIFRALLKNARPVQIFYHLGLFFIGLSVAIIFRQAVFLPNFFNFLVLFLLAISVIFLWLSSVIVNDYFDTEIDKITNQNRPLILKIIDKKNYLKIAFYLFFVAVIISILINFSITIYLFFYYALTLIYNIPPLRLKKFLGLATFLSALASIIVIFIGYLALVPENNLKDFPANLIYLFLITFTISLPLKDFKDIEGDKKDKIFTLPVIFGEELARIILGFNFFVSFLLSVYFLNEKKLLIPALIFGTLSFLIINLKLKSNYLFNQRKIIPLIFLLVFLYGSILVYITFAEKLKLFIY